MSNLMAELCINAVKQYVANEKQDLLKAIENLEQQVKMLSEKSSDDVLPLIEELVAKQVEALPKPENGKDGSSVSTDDVLPLIEELVAKQVEALPKPENGKDAVDIEILPMIDRTKSYPRGTYASHEGGLWKSYETTQGMRGWECIVDGVQSIEEEYDGERTINRKTHMSSGEVVETLIKMPIVLDRGIYKSDQSYEKGDGVTFGGSFWIATKDSPSTQPKAGEDWRLAVKRGRDGKESISVQKEDKPLKIGG